MSYQQESSQPFRWHYAEFDDSNFQIRGRTLFFIIVLFSVILLVALLFLYARWVCRFDPPPPPSATSTSSWPTRRSAGRGVSTRPLLTACQLCCTRARLLAKRSAVYAWGYLEMATK
ncbi:UNVERIFIED_CONTAM: RING-H2 finger protein ATL66 [Sesamum radiatum]|uniref:RING-H2 finger protein ATL66 n=1 Tax=Sesamum radiatum TaxID=300843 RepID=A0AAW2KBS3_SESRA